MILIALGANLPSAAGGPLATLKAALAVLEKRGVNVTRVSRFYESEAWPDPSDPPYVNAVARVETCLPPEELLGLLHAVELEFGRSRLVKNAPRTLDLDIVDYEGLVRTGALELPHPRAASRAFVLMPLKDVAPDWRDPISGKRVSKLIASLPPAKIEVLP